MKKETQADHVAEMKEQMFEPVVTRNKLPGIKNLHNKSIENIAAVLMTVLKSQPNIKEVRWVVGEYIELTSDPLE